MLYLLLLVTPKPVYLKCPELRLQGHILRDSLRDMWMRVNQDVESTRVRASLGPCLELVYSKVEKDNLHSIRRNQELNKITPEKGPKTC